ncbi:four helix bundle protein [Candidatus Venteria ishoeyi]|uniref:Four helix bundle protein n=1 Tax=Candidatus Venteria ishoeyi TaxID=1899563 RepID=A0A1H6F648_9GAMM|nr:four helix bundle protein [Candidatus Venteria ishoeyi]MDM8548389.1 four helix bundle protein [Candidatus Venteria ishoeyi]SEH05638.1 Uncharacterised protein [Candidatus Venteria ishoeyi]
MESKKYRHPQIFADVLVLYKQYFQAHSNLPKLFRVTIGSEILSELSSLMRLITLANFKKENSEDWKEAISCLKDIRSRVELLKSYFFVAWEMKLISHGFYADVSNRIESISKQAARWEAWIRKQLTNNKHRS